MPGLGCVRGARGASPRLGVMQGLGIAPGTAHPALPGAWRVSCNRRGSVNKTFSDIFERAESLLPHRTSSQPHALLWAPSPAHGAGRLLPGQSTEQGRASLRCQGPAEQAEAGRRRTKGRDGCRELTGMCTRVSSPASGEEKAGLMDAVLRHSAGGRELFQVLERLVQGEPALQAGPFALPQTLCKVPAWEIDQDMQGPADGGGQAWAQGMQRQDKALRRMAERRSRCSVEVKSPGRRPSCPSLLHRCCQL